MEYRKAQLIRLVNGSLCLIPLEEIKNGLFDFNKRHKNCEFIKITPPKINLWVYKSYNGITTMGDEDHTALPITELELKKILEDKQGLCYIQVNDSNEICAPSNGLGHCSILIRLSLPESLSKASEKFIF